VCNRGQWDRLDWSVNGDECFRCDTLPHAGGRAFPAWHVGRGRWDGREVRGKVLGFIEGGRVDGSRWCIEVMKSGEMGDIW